MRAPPAFAGVVIAPRECCVNRLAAVGAGQKALIGKPMLIARATPPVLRLFQVHDALDALKFLRRDKTLCDHLEPNDILRCPGHFTTSGLSAVHARVSSRSRDVAFLVDHAPAGPDWISQDEMHSSRGHADQLRQLDVALIPSQEPPERFPNPLRFRFVIKSLAFLVSHAPRQNDLALREFATAPLFLLRGPDALKDFRPFKAGDCCPD